MTMRPVTRLAPFLIAIAAWAQQPYLNLDFETATRGILWYWAIATPGYDYSVDTMDFQSGAQSLRIRSTAAASNVAGREIEEIPVELVRGKHVRVNGWMKTQEVNGYAAIRWRVEDASGTLLSLDDMAQTGPRGTTGWAQFSLDRDVSPNAAAVYLIVALSGTGTAWFDTLKIEIDGAPYVEGRAPYSGEPTQQQLDWVRGAAIPVAGTDPTLSLDDLAPLKDLIGNAHVVGLGEDTHGTSEFLRMKHRVIEYLASQLGFTTFAIEANMPEAYAVNDYVLNGNGDPKQLLKGMYFWTWNTQEVLDIIVWMRQFNQSGKGRIQFTGFDMQTPDVALQIAKNFLAKADPGLADQATSAYATLQKQLLAPAFGFATGTFPVTAAAGKHLRYTGYIKTQGVTTGWAGLWWRADGPGGSVLAFDNMVTHGATGTADWKQFEINLDIPANATDINFGALLVGNGTAWFDTLAVELDGTPYVNDALFDFDFESPAPKGFFTGGCGYSVQLDSTVAHTGNQSLRMQYVGGCPGVTADTVAQCRAVVTRMESSRDMYLSGGFAAADIDWATQNARIVAQAADLASTQNPGVRDADMASNIKWIVNQAPPGSRVVLWAHNYHVSRQRGAMGSYLAAQYGPDYVALGFAFHDGSYNAVGPQGLKPYDASPSFPGSAEYVLHSTGTAPFILDLRKAAPDDPGSSWLLDDHQFRSIGAVAVDGFFVTRTLTKDFDALIYFEHSSPSALLPF